MRFDGKLTARLPQVNVDPEMLALITHRANRMQRPVGSEMRHLLTVALYADPEVSFYDSLLLNAPLYAFPRTSTHKFDGAAPCASVGVEKSHEHAGPLTTTAAPNPLPAKPAVMKRKEKTA